MTDFWQRLKQRKLIQWAVAYVAAAFGLLQGVDIIAERFAWSETITRGLIIASVIGFFVALLLAWYHGERGAQKVSGTELLLLALLLVIGGGFIWQFSGTTTPAYSDAEAASESLATVDASAPESEIPAKSIAVLSFENLSADKDNEFFASGMQDMILTRLAEIRDLKVISRSSTLEYGSRPSNLKRIAKQLGVATLLEGSVQKVGDQVLINLQLIDADTGTHIWAEVYRRTLDNIFDVEAEVAQKVAEALHASLTGAEAAAVARASTNSPQAYELYLKARYEVGQYFEGANEPAHLLLAESYTRQAIAKDPDFALAHAQLAGTISMIWVNGIKDSPERRAEAMAHARKALELQPALAAGHLALGILLQSLDHDYDGAMAEVRTAQSLAPNDASAPHVLAQFLASAGRWTEAQAANADAMELDPRSVSILLWGVSIAESRGDYERAQRLTDKIRAEFPDQPAGPQRAAELFLLRGDPAAARRVLADLPEAQQADLLIQSHFLSRDYGAMRQAAAKVPPAGRDSDAGQRELDQGIAAQLGGDDVGAKAALNAAASAIQQALLAMPDDVSLTTRLVTVRMWQGDRAGAMQALAQARQLPLPFMSRALSELSIGLQEAQLLAHFGDAEAAVIQLRRLLGRPGIGSILSPALLRLDPTWDPIRASPQFKALLRDYPADVAAAAQKPAQD